MRLADQASTLDFRIGSSTALKSTVMLVAILLSAILPASATTGRLSGTYSPASQTCLANPALARPLVQSRIAVVMPVLTATPYSPYVYGTFYSFYAKYATATGYVKTDLNWLVNPVDGGLEYGQGWGKSLPLFDFLHSQQFQDCGFSFGRNLFELSDLDVANGALFNPNGSAHYSAVVTGFSEYVTRQEFLQFKHFVAIGGRMVIMGGDNLMAEVKYSQGLETYVRGHSWVFNGTAAWHAGGISSWNNDDLNWIGSRYSGRISNYLFTGATLNKTNSIGSVLSRIFGNVVFKTYLGHEEGRLFNRTHTSIIADFSNILGYPLDSYVHAYRKGYVVCLCIFADDIIESSPYSTGRGPTFGDPAIQYFLVLALTVNLNLSTFPSSGLSNMKICSDGICLRLN